jgi:predicted ATPase/tRNA A-37 threonylcarbamoyl transferase component Bud32
VQGRRIGRFEVEGALGAGGMGVVYAARDTVLERRVALKLLHARADDAAARARLLREARSAAALSHPNVVTVFEVGDDQGVVFVAMELVAGESLADRIERAPLTLEEALTLALGIARGLQSAHHVGVVHRDLKPANVVLATPELPKIVDFGLARAPARRSEEDSTLSGQVAGTPGYMAPEQIRGEATDERADVFAFGVVLHEMIARRLPFGGSGLSAMTATLIDEPAPLGDAAPPPIASLVARCLAKDPRARPANADELVETLERALGRAPTAAPAAHASASRPRSEPRATSDAPALLGREALLAQLLGEDAPIVTLTGPPGIGKSALAAALAARDEVVVHVALAGVRTLAEAERAIAEALGGATLGDALALARGTLVLDGGEAIARELAAPVERWVTSAPLRIVRAARNALGCSNEVVLVVPPLDAESGRELFFRRARRARAALPVDRETVAAVDRIVAFLDGNPLAIVLAAARVGLLTPAQIATRLQSRGDARFAMLRDTESAASLHDAIAWSFDLLKPEARAVAGHVAIFEGEVDLEAIEELLTEIEVVDPMGALESLRAASLLRTREREGRVLARLDPHVRAFARPSEPHDALRRAYVQIVGAEARRALDSGRAPERVERTDLRVAMLRASNELAVAIACASALAPSRAYETLDAELAALLERAPSIDLELRVHAELALFRLIEDRDVERALDVARRALANAEVALRSGRTHGPTLRARARTALFDACLGAARLDEATEVARTAHADAVARGNVGDECEALGKLGTVGWRRSALEEALDAHRRALALAETTRDRARQARALLDVGVLLVQQGRLAEARGFYERSRELARAEGLTGMVAAIANNLGVVHHEQDRLEDAALAFREAIDESRASRRARVVAIATGNLAMVEHERAFALLAAAATGGAHATQPSPEGGRGPGVGMHHAFDATRDPRAAFDATLDPRAAFDATLDPRAAFDATFDPRSGRAPLEALTAARVGLDEAIRILEALGDARYRAVFLGARAAVHADLGATDDATRDLDGAGRLLARAHEPQLAMALSIRAAHVALATAADDATRAEAVHVAGSHLSEAQSPSSLSARSDLARMALRALRAAVASRDA